MEIGNLSKAGTETLRKKGIQVNQFEFESGEVLEELLFFTQYPTLLSFTNLTIISQASHVKNYVITYTYSFKLDIGLNYKASYKGKFTESCLEK